MTGLQTLNTAYPSIEPWFDLRPYLINGWTSLGGQTFGIGVTPNSLMITARLIADQATSWFVAEGIPFRGPQNMPISATLDGVPVTTELRRSDGILLVNSRGRPSDRVGELTISGVIPRGTTV